jgi:hypothetical protein
MDIQSVQYQLNVFLLKNEKNIGYDSFLFPVDYTPAIPRIGEFLLSDKLTEYSVHQVFEVSHIIRPSEKEPSKLIHTVLVQAEWLRKESVPKEAT